MKKVCFLFALLMPFALMAQPPKKAPVKKAPVKTTPVKKTATVVMKTTEDSLSYALGSNMSNQLKGIDMEKMNYSLFTEGLKDGMENKTPKITVEQMTQLFNVKRAALMKKELDKNKAEANAFLAQNKKRPGVYTTPSGLQYEIIKADSGSKPSLIDSVTCHYKGTLLNGYEFDNSYNRGEPVTFALTGVIRGWTEALQLMHKGSKWKLYVPSDLGYGDNGYGQDIPGGAMLLFEVELLDIKPKQ
jgi:FKBP-type peptidyl-prolyl cis-trans isomerase